MPGPRGRWLTIWAAQHDERTFEPRPARAFEPVALSAGESVGILRLLMSLPAPSPSVQAAIRAGAAWFEIRPPERHSASCEGRRQADAAHCSRSAAALGAVL